MGESQGGGIVAEKTPRNGWRLEAAILADYSLGGVQAVATTGRLVVGSGSGSQIAAYAITAKNLIVPVVGTHVITPNQDEAPGRLREH